MEKLLQDDVSANLSFGLLPSNTFNEDGDAITFEECRSDSFVRLKYCECYRYCLCSSPPSKLSDLSSSLRSFFSQLTPLSYLSWPIIPSPSSKASHCSPLSHFSHISPYHLSPLTSLSFPCLNLSLAYPLSPLVFTVLVISIWRTKLFPMMVVWLDR